MILTHDFSSNDDYDRVNSEVSAGKGRLSLVDNVSQAFTEDFADDTDFTYDSDKVEFVGGALRQKNKKPANSIFYASYSEDENENANWGAGTLTGLGTASAASGFLDCSIGNAFIDYDADNIATLLNAGCIRKRWKSNYNGNAPTTQQFVLMGNGNENKITIRHLSDQLQAYVYDSAGVLKLSLQFTFSAVLGTLYELELNFDLIGGTAKIFLNGDLQASATGTGTRTSPNFFRIGNTLNQSFYLGDLLIFDSVQHDSNYTPDWSNIYETEYLADIVNLPTMDYPGVGEIQSVDGVTKTGTNIPSHSVASDADSVDIELTFAASNTQQDISNLEVEYTGQDYSSEGTLETNNYFDASVIASMLATITESGNNKVYFVMKMGSDYLYYNGSAWVASDKSIGQSNSKAELEANITTLITSSQRCKVYIILVSEDGSETPDIDSLVITYTFGGLEPGEGNMTRVFGYVKDMEENPIEGATVTIELAIGANEYCEASDKMMSKKIVKTTNDDGYWFAYIPWTSEFDSTGTISYKIKVEKTDVISLTKKDGDDIEFTIADSTDELNLTDRISMAA